MFAIEQTPNYWLRRCIMFFGYYVKSSDISLKNQGDRRTTHGMTKKIKVNPTPSENFKVFCLFNESEVIQRDPDGTAIVEVPDE